MRVILLTACVFSLFAFGCAKVRVEAPKEAFKVDISMRLDIYQHVAKDIDVIEDIVSGGAKKAGMPDAKSSLGFFSGTAYAQEALSPEVERAVYRRRDRNAELARLEVSGVVGENSRGLVEMRSAARPDVSALVDAENSDRMIIYNAIASKNSTSLEEVQKLYARRLQSDAPPGTPIETGDPAGGNVWKVK